jgi:uncharacterized phage protein (TIGR02220 family)
MAENKNSFILYTDQRELFTKLPNEKAGELIKHIFSYVCDENPNTDDLLIDLAFSPIKQSLKRDLKKWEKYIEKQVVNGKKGGRPKTQKNPKNPTVLKKTQANPSKPKKADSVSVSVSVSDSVSNNTSKPRINFEAFLTHFNEITGKKHRTITKKVKEQLNARLKDGFTKAEIMKAVVNCAKDEYHRETNLKYLTPEFITRADKLDKYLNTNPDGDAERLKKLDIAKWR